MKKNSESKKQLYRIYLPVNLADRRMSKKKKKNIFYYLIYAIVTLSKMAGKTGPFL